MIKSLILGTILLSSSLLAQDALEEAIILNDEMQFLENSAKNLNTQPLNMNSITPTTTNTSNEDRASSLESTYFGDSSDQVKTKTAAPKRRAAP